MDNAHHRHVIEIRLNDPLRNTKGADPFRRREGFVKGILKARLVERGPVGESPSCNPWKDLVRAPAGASGIATGAHQGDGASDPRIAKKSCAGITDTSGGGRATLGRLYAMTLPNRSGT